MIVQKQKLHNWRPEEQNEHLTTNQWQENKEFSQKGKWPEYAKYEKKIKNQETQLNRPTSMIVGVSEEKKKIKGKNVYLPKKGSGKYIANPY